MIKQIYIVGDIQVNLDSSNKIEYLKSQAYEIYFINRVPSLTHTGIFSAFPFLPSINDLLNVAPGSLCVIIDARMLHFIQKIEHIDQQLDEYGRKVVLTARGSVLAVDEGLEGLPITAPLFAHLKLDVHSKATHASPVHIPSAFFIAFDPCHVRIFREDFNSSAQNWVIPHFMLAAVCGSREIPIVSLPDESEFEDGSDWDIENLGSIEFSWLKAVLFQDLYWSKAATLKRLQMSITDKNILQKLVQEFQSATSKARYWTESPVLQKLLAKNIVSHLDELTKVQSLIQAKGDRKYSNKDSTEAVSKESILSTFDLIEKKDEQVIFSLASYDARSDALEKIIASCLPQADRVFVYLNNYSEIPHFLSDPRITVYLSQDYFDAKANGKMFFLREKIKGYIFVIDDDNLIPPDYVDRLTSAIEQYGRRAALTVHGSTLVQSSPWYYVRNCVFPFQKAQGSDRFVSLPGSGTFAYHTDTLDLNWSQFMPLTMVDLTLAMECKKQNVPIVSIRRENFWLKHMRDIVKSGLYEQFVLLHTHHTPYMQLAEPWDFQVYKNIVREKILPLVQGNLHLNKSRMDTDFFKSIDDNSVPPSWSTSSKVYEGSLIKHENKILAECAQIKSFLNNAKVFKGECYNRLVTEISNESVIKLNFPGLLIFSSNRFRRRTEEASLEAIGLQMLRLIKSPDRKKIGRLVNLVRGYIKN